MARLERKSLGVLTQANHFLEDNEKAREYGEMFKFFNEKTGLLHDRDLDVISMLLGNLEPNENEGDSGNADSKVELFKDMYDQAVESGGKDSILAVNGASCIALAMIEAGRNEESFYW